MLELSEYKTILDTIPAAVIIAVPVKQDEKITDFSIVYVNECFRNLTKNFIKEGVLFSSFKEKISQDINWFDMAVETIKTKKTIEETFYSHNFSIWIQLVEKCVPGDYVAVSLTNVSQAKEYESALSEQNKKLEEVTSQLKSSRLNLDSQLKNIQQLNEQLLFAAYHDSLTDLYNRSWLSTMMKVQIKETTEKNEKFGILLFDIDNMKDINDSRGHNAGDELLKQVATILKLMESKTVTATRFGGDEFVLLYKNIKDRDEAIEISKKALRFLNAEGIGISGGISIFPDDSKKTEDLLKFADMAKIEAKKNGKNNVACFHSLMQEKFLSKLNIETKMSKAMASRNFQLYYQPQFDAKTKELRGFEALLRWYDSDLGWISPEQFIPLAEETNLVVPLGDWVMTTALATIKEWEMKFSFNGIMSVNVSPVQFVQEDFIEKLFKKIEKSGIDKKHLEIEITEGVLIDNVEDTISKLNKIREQGVGLSLDDFGTGYSSLRYLQLLPLTTLKIDKSFVSNIAAKDGFEAKLTESIISLVSKMGLNTIAEGVENEEQLKMIQKFNCRTIQGFLLGKPMPKEQCEKLLVENLGKTSS
ncbi:MAG: bifunctional diguanylate cyclase/phosphodiesterase [Treponema succinifaciens]|uniref:putative bifunctional diguanylate cyclase/phosphodiesterase n=1 Tax=Treponema TaxID=157 RepID=UPI0023F2C08F|nr:MULTISPECIES: bifunctional diguanylate cyclase/phosphodiesterase [Treponema]MDD6963279.1 bifunctional diguanylate cyclase/phosphodiesterase [Treponema succinifaciens]MDY5116947.1 bifunctional diguanylate cyclase/phosphodiesterase [Treponema succinifaciens]